MNEESRYDEEHEEVEEHLSSASSNDAEDEAEEEEHDDEEEEEVELTDDFIERHYALPQLPGAPVPSTIRGISTEEVYSTILQLRRQHDDLAERERAKEVLKNHSTFLLAVTQVLQESGLLVIPTVNSDGSFGEVSVPLPEAPQPELPPGYNSWAIERVISE